MTWVRIDDQFQDHPKFLDVSLAGVGLWATGLAYCSRYLTDGVVPTSALKRLNGTTKLAAELVASGLWEPVEKGWQVHDYLVYNPSASKTRAIRETRQAAGKAGGRARGAQLHSEANGKQIASDLPSKQEANENGRLQRRSAPVPSRPLLGKSSSSTSVLSQPVDNPDDDDGSSPDAIAAQAVTTLAEHALDRRRREVPDQPIRRSTSWLTTCALELQTEHGPRIVALASEGRTADQIVNEIENPQVNGPPPIVYQVCQHCELPHEGPCFLDPNHPKPWLGAVDGTR